MLRWLASYLLTPADPATIAADLAVVLAGLPYAAAGGGAPLPAAAPREAQPA